MSRRRCPRVVDGDRGALPRAPCAGHGRAAAGPPLRGRCQSHRPPRDHPHRDSPAHADLPPDERKIYDLICRRLLSAWHEDHIWSVTTVITAIRNDAIVDRYHTSGSAVQQVGWKVLDLAPAKPKKAGTEGARGRGETDAAARARARASRRTWWMSRCCRRRRARPSASPKPRC